MKLNMCEKGHYWNPEEYDSCPTCSGAYGATVPLKSEALEKTVHEGMASTAPLGETRPMMDTMPVDPSQYNPMSNKIDESKTVPAYQIEGINGKINPVVGWLVCIDGVEKGKDYRLHGGYNHIGRNAHMDVYIRGDEQISRESNAWIAYDELSKQYLFGAGNGTNFVYLNNKPVPLGQSAEIKALDIIRVGKTQLIFAPLCGESFDWSESDEKKD